MADNAATPALDLLLGISKHPEFFDVQGHECYDCPFATVTPGEPAPNVFDPGEGYYDCSLLGISRVWGESPKCKVEDWQRRAREEIGRA